MSDPNAKIKNRGFYHGFTKTEQLKSYDLNVFNDVSSIHRERSGKTIEITTVVDTNLLISRLLTQKKTIM
jgi:hypothetical protein